MSDPNFAYWHSATLQQRRHQGDLHRRVGRRHRAPAAGRPTSRSGVPTRSSTSSTTSWSSRSYYKLPAPQTDAGELRRPQRLAHPGPGSRHHGAGLVPGRPVGVRLHRLGNPVEIAYFDRGPINAPNPTGLNLGGFWSTYWYNGNIYGNEIARGFDAFELTDERPALRGRDRRPPARCSSDGVQRPAPEQIVWAPSFSVAGSYFDQAERSGALSAEPLAAVSESLATARAYAAEGPRRLL